MRTRKLDAIQKKIAKTHGPEVSHLARMAARGHPRVAIAAEAELVAAVGQQAADDLIARFRPPDPPDPTEMTADALMRTGAV